MRKILSAAIVAAVLSATLFALTGCTKSPFELYFNGFASTAGFTAAEATLTLPEGVFVEGYFEEADRYSIKKDSGVDDTDGNPVYVYGIASPTEILIEPSFLWIYDVSGDYAIVSRLTVDENAQVAARYGLIRVYGKNRYSDMTTFRHNAASDEYPPIRFDGDTIAMLGDRYAEGTDRFTFYDREMNELFKIKSAVFVNFKTTESHLVLYPGVSSAEFYRTDLKDADGYLVKTDDYTPFSEEEITTLDCTVTVNYLGNGWFLRSATAASKTDFTGCNVILNESAATGSYLKVVSDRYDANGKSAYNNRTLMPVLAVNQYNRKEMRELSAYENSIEIPSEEDKKPVYQTPVYPVSDLVKDGYTVVYSYYYLDESAKSVDISFAILDGTSKAPTVVPSLYMPLLFIDGTGFEVASPMFNPPYYQAGVYDRAGKLRVIEAAVEFTSYASASIHHGGITLVNHVDLLAAFEEEATYAAYRGSELLVNFGRYHEFTPYFSGCATASRYDRRAQKRTYYRLTDAGAETVLAGVEALKNGVYLTKTTEGEKTFYSLYANDGAELLKDKETLQVSELFLKDGKFVVTTVYTVENGRGVIYSLK